MDMYVTNTINVDNDTIRFTSENKCRPWGVSSSYSKENYFGDKRTSYNICLIPLGSFNFEGKSVRIRLRVYVYKPSHQFPQFCWALCSSEKNKKLYEYAHGPVEDDTKIVSGTAELDKLYWAWQEFEFETGDIPSGVPLYVYLWPYSAGGVAHIGKEITATVFYEKGGESIGLDH